MLLEDEKELNHKIVLAALGAFVRDDPELTAARAVLKREWERATGSAYLGFLAGAVPSPDDVPGDPAPDVELAHAWLYGDLVHGSPDVPARTLQANLDMRYLAAVLVYGHAVYATVATLNVLRQAVSQGLVELPAWSETEPIAVMAPFVIPISKMRITPLVSDDSEGITTANTPD